MVGRSAFNKISENPSLRNHTTTNKEDDGILNKTKAKRLSRFDPNNILNNSHDGNDILRSRAISINQLSMVDTRLVDSYVETESSSILLDG